MAILHLEHGESLGAVIADINDLCFSPVVTFVGRLFPDPESETVVVGTGVRHNEDIVVCVVQRGRRVGGHSGTVVPVGRRVPVEPETTPAVLGGLDDVVKVKRDLRCSISSI